jgi:ABC-type nitrate/sulfonate/bicarbonate transport system permease component
MASPGRAVARINVAGLLTMAVLAGLWEALVRLHVLEYQYLPAPSAVAQGGAALVASGELGANVVHTLTATLLGWFAASSLGVGLGLVLGLSPAAWRYSMSSIEATKAIPPITLVPAALLVFGFSLRMELILVVYVGIWPVLINTIGAVRGVPGELLDVARILRMSRLTTIKKIVLPAAAPTIAVGLRLALSLCLVLAVVAEMVGNPSGLGNAVVRARQALQPEEMFAYVLTTGLLGVALNIGFRYVSSRRLPSLVAAREADS